MRIQQIRNATLLLTYAGKRILVDPWLADKETFPPIPTPPNQDQWNPRVDLPISMEETVRVDAVIVTHLHFDHFDETAKNALPKTLPIFVQNEPEAAQMRDFRFQNVSVLPESGLDFDGITLTRTGGIHGRGESVRIMYEKFGASEKVCGVVLSHSDEKTIYLAGDTVWCDAVKESIGKHRPDIIVLNAGDARFPDGTPIIMGADDVRNVCQAAPNVTVIASHMEAVNHAMLSRKTLREFVNENGLGKQVLVPEDGESYEF